jgi:hypothetical protein
MALEETAREKKKGTCKPMERSFTCLYIFPVKNIIILFLLYVTGYVLEGGDGKHMNLHMFHKTCQKY